jgi:hypothetical protein
VWLHALRPAIVYLKKHITDKIIKTFSWEQKVELLHKALREAGSGLELYKMFDEMISTFPSTLPSIQSLFKSLDERDIEIQKQLMPFAIMILPSQQNVQLLRNALPKARSGLELHKIFAEMIGTFPSTLPSIESLSEGLDQDEGDFEIQKRLMPFVIAELPAKKFFDESWRETTFDFVKEQTLEVQEQHMHRLEQQIDEFSPEIIEFIASELPDTLITFEECARWSVDRAISENAKKMLLGRNITDIVLLCVTRGDAETDVLRKIVEKLKPEDAEALVRAFTHCHSENGKRIAQSLFANGTQSNLTKEKFRAIVSEPVTARDPPVFHAAAERLVGELKRGALDGEIRALQAELKTVIKEACKCYKKPGTTIFDSMEARQRIANEIAVCCFDDIG